MQSENDNIRQINTYLLHVADPSWESNRFAASQEIFSILWNSKVNYRIHQRLVLPNSLFPSGFPTKTLYTPLPSPIRATYPAHLILLDFIARTIVGEFRSLSSSLWSFSPLPFYLVPIRPKYSPQKQIQFINILNALVTQWQLFWPCPSSNFLMKHAVSEVGYASVFRQGKHLI
jgi:hypothetical protein